MIKSDQAIKDLIKSAQDGNNISHNKLIKLMQDNGCMQIINRYMYLNRILEPDDVKSLFWLGTILAIKDVKMNIGDPMQYLIWRGENQIKSEYRKQLSKNISIICNICGKIAKLYRVEKAYKCRYCGSEDIKTYKNETNFTTIQSNNTEIEITEEVYDNIRFKIDINEFKCKLPNKESKIFELITKNGINGSNHKNYIEEIANIMEISEPCAATYIKRIRIKLKEHIKYE